MLETTLITDVELMEAVVETAAGSTPAVRYRAAAMSEAGQFHNSPRLRQSSWLNISQGSQAMPLRKVLCNPQLKTILLPPQQCWQVRSARLKP